MKISYILLAVYENYDKQTAKLKLGVEKDI